MAELELEVTAGVATITINRPGKRNALSAEVAEHLVQLCDRIDADKRIGAAVVRGAAGSFCAGAERGLLDGAGEDPLNEEHFNALGSVYRSFMRVGTLRVPVVAAVRGAAVGAGMNLLLSTDLRIIAEDARLIAGFARIGLHPGGGHFKLASRLAGREATAAMALFSEGINGRRAAELGLCWEACPDNEVEGKAYDLAAKAASDPALARYMTQTFRLLSDQGPDWLTAMEAERAAQLWSLRRRYLAI